MENLTQQQVQQMIDSALQKRELDNSNGVSLIAAHSHNGINSQQIDRAANLLPIVVTGVAAPTTKPNRIGDLFVNTTLKKIYVATATNTSADWTLVN